MNKNNRSFTVEYKKGRRKAERKPSSIWGDLDLRSVALQANDAAISSQGEHDTFLNSLGLEGQDRPKEPLLTPGVPQKNNASATEEISMPDENETVSETTAPDPGGVAAAPMKQRKPRAKKAAADTARSQAAGVASTERTDAKDARGKRGRKAKTISVVKLAGSKLSARSQSASGVDVAAPITEVDDMVELLRLEDENRSLRKQLSEKLRAENADLRKRLNLA